MSDVTLSERPATEKVVKWGLIDADAHIDPPYDMWQNYLPEKLRPLAPVIEYGDEVDHIIFEGNRRPVRMINNQAGRTGKDFKMVGKLSEQRNTYDPHARLADMDTDGIQTAVLFGGGPLGTTNSELYIASYEAYSRWVMDWASIAPNRLVPIGYVPMRDVAETIGIVKWMAQMGFKAINIPAFPQNPDGWSTSAGVAAIKAGQGSALTGDPQGKLQYWQEEFEPLWKTIVDLGLVVTFHLGGRVPRFGDKRHFLPDMPMSKLAMAEPIGIFIFNGILDRYPTLKIATIESGVGWMSWYGEYCDRTWERQRYWTDSVIKELPTYYMDRQVYGSFIQDRIGIMLRNETGGKNIMWSSDYPHSETTFPHSHDIIARDFKGVPEADIKAITADICRDLYGLD